MWWNVYFVCFQLSPEYESTVAQRNAAPLDDLFERPFFRGIFVFRTHFLLHAFTTLTTVMPFYSTCLLWNGPYSDCKLKMFYLK